MTEFTITHRIEAPDLSAALNNLADALKARPVAAPVVQIDGKAKSEASTPPAQETPVQAPAAAPMPAPQPTPTNAPVTGVVSGAASATTNAPAPVTGADAAPVTGVTSDPTPAPAPAKTFTYEDIVNAGGQLLEMDRQQQTNTRMSQLMELLKGFGVQAITQLKPEQYADVAVALRGLGATI